MKLIAAWVALALGASISGCAHHEVVGYYAGWKPASAIAPHDVTVVNYAFAYVSVDGSLIDEGSPMEEAALARLAALKRADRDLRVMVSVGGWTRSNRFSGMADDVRMRAAFIQSAIAFLRRHRFDGIDIDWEYPGDIGYPCPSGETCQRPEDKANFVRLARDLRAALDAAGVADGKRYLVTIAAGADEKFLFDPAGSGAWLRELAESLDWINLMSYDYHGSWERVAGLNAPLHRDPADPVGSNVEASVKRLIAHGIAADKITLGIPFYGKGWSGCAPGPAGDGLHQSCAGLASGSADESFDFAYLADRGYLARDADGRYTVPGRGFVRHWNAAAQVPYLYNASNGVFITYDDEASVRAKADFAREQGLRGTMFWEIGADAHGVLRRMIAP
ncbi:MAG TPA: glycoside hydrolase family 18 protein [Usitatibacter sp.]|nr:glycoside hydrolase family 18 protein [Usitatibacter sp.]